MGIDDVEDNYRSTPGGVDFSFVGSLKKSSQVINKENGIPLFLLPANNESCELFPQSGIKRCGSSVGRAKD
jgi:hypothetical protein